MALIKSVRGFDPKFGQNCYFSVDSLKEHIFVRHFQQQ